ncbi:MAG: hypothetical protein ACYTHM_14925, partial [Planctomycetota bacterium]
MYAVDPGRDVVHVLLLVEGAVGIDFEEEVEGVFGRTTGGAEGGDLGFLGGFVASCGAHLPHGVQLVDGVGDVEVVDV